METLTSSFPFFTANPNLQNTKLLELSKHFLTRVSIKPPPPDFDFRSSILTQSRTKIAQIHPELSDLADNGTLILVEKWQFGPVPSWRSEFVEPEVIWLIGTEHLSRESGVDVDRVVRAVRPDNVVVELCRSRAGIMYTSDDGEQDQLLRSNMFSLSGNGFFGAVGRSINLGWYYHFILAYNGHKVINLFHHLTGGQTALALRLLLALFSSKISSKISSSVNRPFGDEFRVARKASEEVGAQIVLGDRPIEITLERAWEALKFNEKLSLATSVVRGITLPSNFSADKLKESITDDSTFQLYKQLSFSYPSLLQPLIHERDTYLAWSLKRSKAVNNGKRVVGVIGKGHMNGVIYALISDLGDLRFRDLVGQKVSSREGRSNGWIDSLVKNLVKDAVIGIVLWALYEQIIKPLL